MADPVLDAIRQLRRAGYTDEQLLAMNPYRTPSAPSAIDRILGRNVVSPVDAVRVARTLPPPPPPVQAPMPQQGPVPTMGAAPRFPIGQQPVTPDMVQQQEMGQVRQWAQDQANDPRAIAQMVEQGVLGASMSPTPLGDVASGVDAAIQLLKGNLGQAGLAAAGALPLIPNLRSAKTFVMPKTGTTRGDETVKLYRYIEGDELRPGNQYGIHWTHDVNEVEEMARDAAGFIVEADHPGYRHVMDWENVIDRPLMEQTIGGYEYRDKVFPEVPIRPGAPINVTSIYRVDSDGRVSKVARRK